MGGYKLKFAWVVRSEDNVQYDKFLFCFTLIYQYQLFQNLKFKHTFFSNHPNMHGVSQLAQLSQTNVK